MRTVIVRLFDPAEDGATTVGATTVGDAAERLRGIVERPGGDRLAFDGPAALVDAVRRLGVGGDQRTG